VEEAEAGVEDVGNLHAANMSYVAGIIVSGYSKALLF